MQFCMWYYTTQILSQFRYISKPCNCGDDAYSLMQILMTLENTEITTILDKH